MALVLAGPPEAERKSIESAAHIHPIYMKKRNTPPAQVRRHRRARWSVAAGLLSAAFISHAHAQTSYYWKGGAGNWDTTTANWYPQASATGPETFVSGTSSVARIGDLGTSGTITLTSAITAQELDLDATGYTITGTTANALTLANGNITNNFVTNNTASAISTTISAPLAGTNINVSATGTAGATTSAGVSGNDTVTLSATNTFSGNLNLGAAASGQAGVVGINRVNITTANAIPTGATINFLNTDTSFAVTGTTAVLSNNFVLNPNGTTYTAGAFSTFIGATSGNGLTVNGKISGNADVTFAAGINGGAGVVLLNSANTYAGATVLANSQTGIVRLGIANGLPTTTKLTFGDGSTSTATVNGTATVQANYFGALDLNGKTQTVSSLATNVAVVAPNGGTTTTNTGVATGVINTSSAQASFIISGNATTTFNSTIGVPTNTTVTNANSNISLTLASTNTGTQTLGGVNSYTGATQIGGGTLVLSSTGSINGSTLVQVGVAGTTTTNVGALTLNNAASLADTGTLSMVTGTTLNLNATSGSETIAALVLDGTTEPAGTYTAAQLNGLDATSGVSNITFTSMGETLTINPVPEPATVFGGLLLVGALGWNQRRRLRGMVSNRRTGLAA